MIGEHILKIGILSDTHNNREAVERVVALCPDAKLWLHAGDCVPDAEYLEMLTDTGVAKVAGNSDFFSADAPNAVIVEAAGHKIFLTHGHSFGVRFGVDELINVAKENGCDMAVYGHTHVAQILPGEVTVINPGSASRPRDEMRPSFAVAELTENNAPQAKIIRFDEA